MVEKANAKINLSLDIKNLRDDGYHNLETIMLPLEMHDTLEVQILPPNATDDFVTCDDFSLKITKYNLVHRIIDEAREKWGFNEHFLINIHKNIFLQAGLGGGSADAGAALRAVLKLLKINATKQDLIDIGIAIGSDVPWAIFNCPTLLKRKGDVLEFFDHVAPFYVLLVKPFDGLSTKEVFETADRCDDIDHGDINLVKELYEKDDLEVIEGPLNETLNDDVFTFVMKIDNDDQKRNKIKEIVSNFEDVQVRFWGGDEYCELYLNGISKSNTIKEIAKIYNVPLDNVIVFGDADNDIEMLRDYRHSYVMKNGHPHLHKIAHNVTRYTNEEDGIIYELKEFFNK